MCVAIISTEAAELCHRGCCGSRSVYTLVSCVGRLCICVIWQAGTADHIGCGGGALAPVSMQVAQDAINDARSICMREYGLAPDVSIYGDPTFTFAYVPSHLHHMIFELVKNSLRAVQDRFEDADDEPPPIRWVGDCCGCPEECRDSSSCHFDRQQGVWKKIQLLPIAWGDCSRCYQDTE